MFSSYNLDGETGDVQHDYCLLWPPVHILTVVSLKCYVCKAFLRSNLFLASDELADDQLHKTGHGRYNAKLIMILL